jgi:hypothetical protein
MILMAVDFPKFFKSAGELYDLWPSFFNWAGLSIISFIGALITATWWMRGFKAGADEARLSGTAGAKEEALRGQIGILEQRLALAAEQQSAAKREGEEFKNELDVLKEKLEQRFALVTKRQPAAAGEFRQIMTNLEVLFGRLLEANNATTITLTAKEVKMGDPIGRPRRQLHLPPPPEP